MKIRRLNEGLWYQIHFQNSQSLNSDYFIYTDNDYQVAQNKIQQLLQNGIWKDHEKLNMSAVETAQQNFSSNHSFSLVQLGKQLPSSQVSQILTFSNRDFRREAKDLINSSSLKSLLQGKKYWIHHIDDREYNNSLDNLVIFFQSNYPSEFFNKIIRVIHSIIHIYQNLTKNIITWQSSGTLINLPYYIYDQQQNKFIIHYINISIT